MSGPSFHRTFLQFCDDLALTFPELTAIQACKRMGELESQTEFQSLWKSRLGAIATRDSTIFNGAGVEVLPGVVIGSSLWSEVSEATHTAIWNYLSSLALLSAAQHASDDFWNEDEFKRGMEEMIRQLKEAGAGSEGGAGSDGSFPFANFGGIFEKLKDMAKGFAEKAASEEAKGGDGSSSSGAGFKIPERMFKGHIARMARELAEEFKPEDFGISPDMMNSEDPSKIFDYLQEIFTKKPDLLMAAAQRIAKKIQVKFQRGEIRREDIINEIQELMKEFSENEAFSAIFGQLGDILNMTAKSTGNEGSERRRQVQERLRKKQAEKEARRAGPLIVSSPAGAAAEAAADAAAAALLLEEATAARQAQAKKKKR